MKKVVLLGMGLLFLLPIVSGYQVNIDAPETLSVGKPLIVTGTTTFGIGTPIDVVLYHQVTTTTEIKRKIVYVQSDKSFRAVFDTTGLSKGTYKVEVPATGLGESVTMRIVQLVDRADDIYLASSSTQPFTGKLYIAGTIKGGQNSGIQVEVFDPSGLEIFGPRYVNTDNIGDFSVEVPVNDPGDYEVSFTDAKGYIGTKTITIVGSQAKSPTPQPSGTQVIVLKSAHAPASQENPAYFIVRPGSNAISLYTSTAVDWVMEYFDDRGVRYTINNAGAATAEKIGLAGKNKTLYVKIYPYQSGVSKEVYLYGENVNSVVVSPTMPAIFAAADTPQPEESPQASLSVLPLIVALGIVACALSLQKK